MANHKKNKMNRSYLKSYSADNISGGKAANAIVLAEYNARVGATEIDRLGVNKIVQYLKKVGDYYTINIQNGKYTKLDLFFGASIFFFKEDVLRNTYYRSITYSTRQRAMDAWREGRIVWIDEFPG